MSAFAPNSENGTVQEKDSTTNIEKTVDDFAMESRQSPTGKAGKPKQKDNTTTSNDVTFAAGGTRTNVGITDPNAAVQEIAENDANMIEVVTNTAMKHENRTEAFATSSKKPELHNRNADENDRGENESTGLDRGSKDQDKAGDKKETNRPPVARENVSADISKGSEQENEDDDDEDSDDDQPDNAESAVDPDDSKPCESIAVQASLVHKGPTLAIDQVTAAKSNVQPQSATKALGKRQRSSTPSSQTRNLRPRPASRTTPSKSAGGSYSSRTPSVSAPPSVNAEQAESKAQGDGPSIPPKSEAKQSSARKPRPFVGTRTSKSKSTPHPVTKTENVSDVRDVPSPVEGPTGKTMTVGEAVFVTQDQLTEEKVKRMKAKGVKPIEEMTFQDLRTYNRDQLRSYCFVYSTPRGKKTEMEASMARFLSWWNRGEGDFALQKYIPTSLRNFDPSELTKPGSHLGPSARQSSGETTPTGVTHPSRLKEAESAGATVLVRKPSSSKASLQNGASTPQHPPASSNLRAGPSAPVPTNVPSNKAASVSVPPAAGSALPNNPAAKNSRSSPPQTSLRMANTSFKQKIHARQASSKFKAAYNGAGPAIVHIVENAAAYFEGKDSPEVILDQSKSFARYQFNVDMLTEIFDGPPDEQEGLAENEESVGKEGEQDRLAKDIARRVINSNARQQTADFQELESRLRELEEETKHTERVNMRLFQKLERAESRAELDKIVQDYKINFVPDPPPVVRRKVNKELTQVELLGPGSRILQFKAS